jgi:hypothetical protein
VKRRAPWVFAWSLLVTAPAGAETAAPPVEVRVLDEQGRRLDAAHLHASLSRTLPAELGSVPGPDRDALRFLLIATPDASLETLSALTSNAQGRPVDVIVNLRTEPATCPDGVAPELVCRQTPPLRLVSDAMDRNHPRVRQRSIRAEVGGTLRIALGAHPLVELAVGGPRRAGGAPIDLLRARLRVLVLRARAGGAPALGGTDAGARQLMQKELASAAAIWGQCGVDLDPTAAAIDIVDPPTTQVLTLGCGLGQPASGGVLRLQSGRQRVSLTTHAGESPTAVALRLAEALANGGKVPQVFENQRATSEALPSADVLLDGPRRWQRSALDPLSSDPTLPLCLGRVDLSDGLTHFGDGDAFAGTLEERALLRSFDDGDPRSIEVMVVPEFERGQRIGESFIVSPGSSLSNSVIIDRSAIAAGARSFALAHELGHVLLAMPGHPDDFGIDQSWSLMDADVADGTIFGPRRLSLADCERVLTQTGPHSLTPLLEAVPLRSGK